MPHIPVLLDAVLQYLDPRPGAFVIDGTLDGGGHARALLERIAPGGILFGIDADPRMPEAFARSFHGAESSCIVAHGNYADLAAMLRERKLPRADGLLLDLGFSSEQLAASGHGFSFLHDEPLLMTYDPARTPVRDLLRRMPEAELALIIRELGGERFAGRVAKAIVAAGRKNPLVTSGELARVVRAALPRTYERGRIDPATRTFQALRIYANDELANLERVLAELPEILAPGGHAAIITFHSLEDGLVKRSFRNYEKTGIAELLTAKPVTASAEEEQVNPRSRSSKLRALRLL